MKLFSSTAKSTNNLRASLLDPQQSPISVGDQQRMPPQKLKIDLAYRINSLILVAGWSTAKVELGLNADSKSLDLRLVPVARPDVANHFSLTSGDDLGFVLVADYAGMDPITLTWLNGHCEQEASQPLQFSMQPTIDAAAHGAHGPALGLLALSLPPHTPQWRSLIAKAPVNSTPCRNVPEEYAQRDGRIKVKLREENGHISVASNSALELAAGDYVALLDHDDELAPQPLQCVVDAINRNPDAQIIYSDEDKIDEGGNRSDPHFISDWNPDLLFSQNYMSHLGVYRRDVLQRIGGFRKGVEGSQDYDLLLRCLPHVKPSEIVHVPRALYHWRVAKGSTALATGEKSYTTGAGIKALRAYFDSQGNVGVTVEAGLVPNTYRTFSQVLLPC